MSLHSYDLRHTIIGALSLILAMGIGRFSFTPLLPMMQADGLLNLMDGGYLASTNLFGYLVGALFAAKLPYSPKFMLRVALLGVGLSILAMGITQHFYLWLGLRFFCGIASALILVLVSKFYIKHLGITNQTWVFSGVGAGILIIGLCTLTFMLLQINSSISWLIIGVSSFVVGIWLCLNIGAEIPTHSSNLLQGKAQRSPLNWPIIIAYGAMGIGYIIPATYLPVMARELISSVTIFGWIWPIFGIATFASVLLSAKLLQRYTNVQTWVGCQWVMAVGLILPVIYPHIFTLIIAGLGVGGTFMVITMAGMKEAHRIAPANDVIRHIAALTASFAIGQMLGPIIASYLYQQSQSFTLSLLLASAALIITAINLMLQPEKKETTRS